MQQVVTHQLEGLVFDGGAIRQVERSGSGHTPIGGPRLRRRVAIRQVERLQHRAGLSEALHADRPDPPTATEVEQTQRTDAAQPDDSLVRDAAASHQRDRGEATARARDAAHADVGHAGQAH
eukprot:7387901-Prymnesium_polylepis.1